MNKVEKNRRSIHQRYVLRNSGPVTTTLISDNGDEALISILSPFELEKKEYLDYLTSKKWQIKRKRALRMAGFHCSKCGNKDKLQVHHKTYVRKFEEEDRDLIVLCDNCHKKIHGK